MSESTLQKPESKVTGSLWPSWVSNLAPATLPSVAPRHFELNIGTYRNPGNGTYASVAAHTGGRLLDGVKVRWVIRIHFHPFHGHGDWVLQMKPDPICDQLVVRKLVDKYIRSHGFKLVYPTLGEDE